MLSKKAQYALKALTYLTQNYNGVSAESPAGMPGLPSVSADPPAVRPVLINEIASKQQIPIKFLESILLQLKNADILDSRKGKGGGYFLKLPPSQIPIAKILRIIDGPIAMLPCVSLYFYKKCEDCQEKKCRINKMFCEVRDATLNILENRTLMDIS